MMNSEIVSRLWEAAQDLRLETPRQLFTSLWELWGTDWDEANQGIYPESLIYEEIPAHSSDWFFSGASCAMLRRWIRYIQAEVHERGRPRILDLGSGAERFIAQIARVFPHAEVLASDVFSADHLSDLDVVTAMGVFHELPVRSHQKVIHEVHRGLRPGGIFIITDVPQYRDASGFECILKRVDEHSRAPFLRGYLGGHLEAQLLKSGFEVVASEQHFLLKTVVAKKMAASKGVEPSTAPRV